MKKLLGVIDRPVNPSPAALITSVDAEGKPNVLTLAEVFNVSIHKPVIVGIAIRPATYSHGLICTAGEFVVNLPSAAIADKVDRCGSVSGRDGLDKFREFGLTPLAATHVRPPLIAECPVNLECKVVGLQTVGDHDLILGEVVAVHADEEALDEQGKLQVDQLDLLVYLSGSYWSLGQRIAPHGFTNRR